MYKITASGSKAAVQAAWDILAWSDPTPADAVDAREETRALWRLDAYAQDEAAAAACADIIKDSSADLSPSIAPVEDKDWVRVSLEGLPAVEAGPFLVAGSHALTSASPGKIPILIEAGPAFGTGHHGTTRGCLLAFDRIRRREKPERVLDVGTGSGVLAIAALKTGSRSAIGTDIDADSVAIARENAEKNAAAGAFKAITATGCRSSRVRKGAPYDLVFANILARPLVRLAPDIRKVTRPGGTIILSGLLTHQEPQVRRAYEGQGLCLIDRLHKDVWSTLVYRKQTIR